MGELLESLGEPATPTKKLSKSHGQVLVSGGGSLVLTLNGRFNGEVIARIDLEGVDERRLRWL